MIKLYDRIVRRRLLKFASGISLMVCFAAAALWVRSYSAADGFRKLLVVNGSGEFRWCVLQAGSDDGRIYLDVEYWHPWGLSHAVHFDSATEREWSAIWRQHQLQRLQQRASIASRSPHAAGASSTSPWKLEWQSWPGQSSNEWAAKLGAPYWAVSITSFGLTAAFWWLRRQNAARFKPGCCTSCGYSLMGNASGVCSECGTPVPGKVEAKA